MVKKMKETTNFFSDPKVIISLFALFISIIGFIWSLANQWDQNRRWDKLNAANVSIKEVKYIRFKELSKEEAMNIQWGYDPIVYSTERLNIYQLPYYLTARNAKTGELINGFNQVFTINEVEQELKRIAYTDKIFLSKAFKPFFILENLGKTDAYDLSIKIEIKWLENDWRNVFTSNTEITLAAGLSSNVTFGFEIPIESKLPPVINYRILLTYGDINNNLTEKEIKAKWTSNDNYWSYGEGSNNKKDTM
jgi:hypothetical protein